MVSTITYGIPLLFLLFGVFYFSLHVQNKDLSIQPVWFWGMHVSHNAFHLWLTVAVAENTDIQEGTCGDGRQGQQSHPGIMLNS